MTKNSRKQALCKGSVQCMWANNGLTVWPEVSYRSSREGMYSLLSSSGQTWLTFTIKVK